VDQYGNINLHVRDDLTIPIAGGAGVGDLSARLLFFEILESDISVPLIANPQNAQGKIVRLTAKQLADVESGAEFALVDRTGGGSVVRWSGTIKRRT